MVNPQQDGNLPKILFIKPSNASFVNVDVESLERCYTVSKFVLHPRKSFFYFTGRLLSMVWYTIRNIRGAKAIVTWFVDYHAALLVFIGKLLDIKVIIFAGGQEAICYPALRKGVFCGRFRSRCASYALRNAWHLIPNHKSLIYHENYYYDPNGKKDGFLHYIPGFNTPLTIVPNGIDTTFFHRDITIQKERNLVITVSTMHNASDFVNKGLDLFIEVARHNVDISFVIIGLIRELQEWVEEQYKVSSIPNLQIVGFCSREVLFSWYNKATVYVQASITEGMPNTLGEAMLCECIPVGSNVNGIPDAMGDTGVLIYRRSPLELAGAVKKALTMHSGAEARAHVLSSFSKEMRTKRIQKLFSEII